MSETLRIQEVPICVSGGITAAGPSLCLDGATHIVNTPIVGSIRLVATNSEAQKALDDFTDTKVVVTVCGYPRRSTNCTHMDVYHAGLADDMKLSLEALAS